MRLVGGLGGAAQAVSKHVIIRQMGGRFIVLVEGHGVLWFSWILDSGNHGRRETPSRVMPKVSMCLPDELKVFTVTFEAAALGLAACLERGDPVHACIKTVALRRRHMLVFIVERIGYGCWQSGWFWNAIRLLMACEVIPWSCAYVTRFLKSCLRCRLRLLGC